MASATFYLVLAQTARHPYMSARIQLVITLNQAIPESKRHDR